MYVLFDNWQGFTYNFNWYILLDGFCEPWESEQMNPLKGNRI